jgi:hypothetical protein
VTNPDSALREGWDLRAATARFVAALPSLSSPGFCRKPSGGVGAQGGKRTNLRTTPHGKACVHAVVPSSTMIGLLVFQANLLLCLVHGTCKVPHLHIPIQTSRSAGEKGEEDARRS